MWLCGVCIGFGFYVSSVFLLCVCVSVVGMGGYGGVAIVLYSFMLLYIIMVTYFFYVSSTYVWLLL